MLMAKGILLLAVIVLDLICLGGALIHPVYSTEPSLVLMVNPVLVVGLNLALLAWLSYVAFKSTNK